MSNKMSGELYWDTLELIEKYNSLTPMGLALIGGDLMGKIHDRIHYDPELTSFFLIKLGVYDD